MAVIIRYTEAINEENEWVKIYTCVTFIFDYKLRKL